MSDVHANPLALESALTDARTQGCVKFVMLGDVTGYGYDVKRALELARENFDIVLMGNHDSACAGLEPDRNVRTNDSYAEDIRQRCGLEKSDLTWLRGLPYTFAEDDCAMTHGDFVNSKGWDYIDGTDSAATNFRFRQEQLMFCGHTHEACVWEQTAEMECRRLELFKTPAVQLETKCLQLRVGSRYIVNVGSVGYPRHDLCATYAIWDPDEPQFVFRRLPFDFKGYLREMLSHEVAVPDWLIGLLLAAGQQ